MEDGLREIGGEATRDGDGYEDRNQDGIDVSIRSFRKSKA